VYACPVVNSRLIESIHCVDYFSLNYSKRELVSAVISRVNDFGGENSILGNLGGFLT